MTVDNLKIEYVGVNELTPYENNAKLHPAEQIEQIKKSIEDYGMCDPIGVWRGEIVEGHGRLIACKELGIDTVPIIRLDNLSDSQRREYMLVHNKTTMNSDFDFEMLDLELNDLDEFDFGFYDFDEPVNSDEFGTDFSLPDGDKNVICQMTFTLHEKQKALIEEAISDVKDIVFETFGNTNNNGNALYEVVRQWAEQRK